VNVERYDTYVAFFTGSKNGVSVRKFPRSVGELVFTLAVPPPHTTSHVSGFYNGVSYHSDWLTLQV
jgi:hypothetical protein